MKKRNWSDEFWKLIKYNWGLEQRIELRAACEAWMAADKSVKP